MLVLLYTVFALHKACRCGPYLNPRALRCPPCLHVSAGIPTLLHIITAIPSLLHVSAGYCANSAWGNLEVSSLLHRAYPNHASIETPSLLRKLYAKVHVCYIETPEYAMIDSLLH